MEILHYTNQPIHRRNKIARHALYFFTALLAFMYSCNTASHSKESVEKAMQQYDHLILKLDADSIALLFTPDGDLGTMAHGRDSIKTFLSSFKNVVVLSQSSTTASIQINKDTAIQKGSYQQSDIINGKDTVKVKGDYTAVWQWLSKEGWHIKQMTTQPTR